LNIDDSRLYPTRQLKNYAILCLMTDTYLVADVGGTQIRAALFPTNLSTPLKIVRTSTQGDGIPPLDRLCDLMASIWPSFGRVAALAVAAPGPSDPYEGIVFEAPNIPGWKNIPLKQHLQERFKIPAAVGNDANLAALGEWRFGAGRGHEHLVYITVSTGIGGGVINDGKLLLGVRGLAGEMGHITVMPDGPMCGCGQRGHLEALASGPAIVKWVEEQLAQGVQSILSEQTRLTARDISRAANENDALAIAALNRAGTYLGIALADYLHIFNPSAIIIGGGVSRSGDHFWTPMKTALREHVLSEAYLKDLVLTTAALGDDVGLMGALALAQSLVQS
jgi:glucokinase